MSTIEEKIFHGSRIYNKRFLKFYDLIVGYLFNTWVWNCPRLRQLDLYDRYLSDNHLEIGSATGWYLKNTRQRYTNPRYVLLDLNSDSLEYAKGMLVKFSPQVIHADIFSTIPAEKPFSSASLSYVLHCLPGPMSFKAQAIGNIATVLSDDGVLFGTTLLGKPGKAFLQAKVFNWLYNKLGIFSNEDDSLVTLVQALNSYFHEVIVDEHWSGALFVAKKPKRNNP